MSDLAIHRYELRPAAALNARHEGGCVYGALVRRDGGYGCLQAWPDLGDDPMDRQIEALRAGGGTALADRALDCCRMDAALREEGASAFAGKEIPVSHATIPAGAAAAAMARAAAAGVLVWKLKAGPDWENRIADWEAALAAQPDARLRLDFNESLTFDEARRFLERLPDSIRAAIDFVEDPCPFVPDMWAVLAGFGVALAADRAVGAPGAERYTGVVKPARDDAARLIEAARESGRRLVVTSYMDHPLGQMWAAWWAVEAVAAGVHHGPAGLATHTLFDPVPGFPVEMSEFGKLSVPSGAGFGYDGALAALNWQPL